MSSINNATTIAPVGKTAMDYFNYIPSKPLAIAALAIFGLITLVFFIRVFISKKASFLYTLSFTAALECVGYAVRILCADFTDLNRFVVMTLFLLLPPNFLALVNYKAVSEIIRLSDIPTKQQPFYLRPKFVTWFFFGSDIFSLFCQGAGGGLQATGTNPDIGKAITLVGLCSQLAFFTFFGYITIHVHRHPEYTYRVEGQENAKQKLIFCLDITLVLLYIRSIYRVAEYATGYGGPIARLEWAFYVFDTLVIIACFSVYTIYFIGNYLPRRGELVDYDVKPSGNYSSSTSVNQLENGKTTTVEMREF